MRSLSKDEILSLLDAARAKRERDWLMILVAFSHGLRASEVVGIVRDDIQDGFLDVQRLKGSKRTIQPLIVHENPLLNEHQPLLAFIAGMHGKQRVFPVTRQRFWQLIQEHGRAAGLPKHKLHPHILKHSIAMYLVERIPINALQKYLGHVNLTNTGIYTEASEEQANQAAAGALAR